MNMTKLEKVLAENLTAVTGVDIIAIIEAAGGSATQRDDTVTEQAGKVTVVETPAAKVKAKKIEPAKTVETPVDNSRPVPTERPRPEPVPEQTADDSPLPGIDITGLFTGSGADKKVVKDVFLAAVEKANNLATLVALNATCDCGYATGDYTEETAAVLKRKLARWGNAQE